MGKALLLSVAAITFITMGVLRQISSDTLDSEKKSLAQASKILAREIAYTGLADAKEIVLTEYEANGEYTGLTALTGDYQGGSYTVSVASSDSLVELTSVGVYNGELYNIVQSFSPQASGGLPSFMNYAMTTGKNMIINKGIELTSLDDSVNASIFANGKMKIGSSSTIDGFAFTADSGGDVSDDVLDPNQNPDGDDEFQVVDALEIPDFDASDHLGVATRTTYGKVTLSGTYALGTKTNPLIWYIGGNLATDGDVNFTGYGTLIVDGNVNIDHNFEGQLLEGKSALGLYANNIHASASAENLSGQWFANNNLKLGKNTEFTGSFVVNNNFHVNDSFKMNFVPANDILTKGIWSEDGSISGSGGEVSLVNVREW